LKRIRPRSHILEDFFGRSSLVFQELFTNVNIRTRFTAMLMKNSPSLVHNERKSLERLQYHCLMDGKKQSICYCNGEISPFYPKASRLPLFFRSPLLLTPSYNRQAYMDIVRRFGPPSFTTIAIKPQQRGSPEIHLNFLVSCFFICR
jgi:hypothetical protein